VAPSTSQSPGLSRRKTASAETNPSEAASTSLAGALARERTRRRGEPDEDEVPFWQRTWFLALLLAMAAASFALALLLYLGLDFPEASPAQSYAAEPDTAVEVGNFLPPSLCDLGSAFGIDKSLMVMDRTSDTIVSPIPC
jgi:hypothetical protein